MLRDGASAAAPEANSSSVSASRVCSESHTNKMPTAIMPKSAVAPIDDGPIKIMYTPKEMAAKADDLRERGTKFSLVHESESAGGKPLIRIEPSELRGQVIEFEEA